MQINLDEQDGRFPRACLHQVGIRVPVGLSYIFDKAPVDIFVEIGPAIDVAPDVRGEVTGGIGVRFWFLSNLEACIPVRMRFKSL